MRTARHAQSAQQFVKMFQFEEFDVSIRAVIISQGFST